MEIYIKASATSLANLLDFESYGDSGMEDGEVSQEGGGDTWMLAASTLPLLVDTSKEVVISDPYRVMASYKQLGNLDFRDENICTKTGTRSEERTKRKNPSDEQGKSNFREEKFGRKNKKKIISSFSPSFSSPVKILPSPAPEMQKKRIALISPQEVAFNQLLES